MENNQSYYLSDMEFYFILSVIKKEKWLGIDLHLEEIKEERINQILISLYQKEHIKIDGQQITFLEPMATMMHILEDCEYMYLLESFDSSKTFYCANSKVTVIERDEHDKENLKITVCKLDDFIDFLKESRYISTIIDAQAEAKVTDEYLTFDKDLDIEDLSMQENILLVLEKYNFNNQTKTGRLIVEDCNLIGQIYIQDENNVRHFLLKEEAYLNAVKEWIEGGNLNDFS